MGYGHQKLGPSISAPSGQITTQKDGTGVSTVELVSALYHSTYLSINMLQESAMQGDDQGVRIFFSKSKQ